MSQATSGKPAKSREILTFPAAMTAEKTGQKNIYKSAIFLLTIYLKWVAAAGFYLSWGGSTMPIVLPRANGSAAQIGQPWRRSCARPKPAGLRM